MYLLSRRIIVFCCFLLAAVPVVAQPFTVNVTLVVKPPYSTQISDYTSQPGKIIATLLYTSPGGGTIQVYLLGSISSLGGISINTDPNYKMPQPVTLYSGQPLVLDQLTIQQIFSNNNLIYSGITQQEVLYGNGLPEDEYQICIRAYDYTSNNPVSNEEPLGCASFNITNVEPPLILNPLCGDSITITPPQNIIMSWTMPVGTPVNTQYYLKIVEILPADRDPNDAMNSAGHPLFFETTQPTTSFIYGPANPALVESKHYAFAVTAIDPSGKTSYRNGGMSEVCSFICRSAHTDSIGKDSTNKADTASMSCSCKTDITDKVVNNSNAKPGVIVHIGAFEMTLGNDVQNKNGFLSGSGTIPVPLLNSNGIKIRVEFTGLQLNASNQAIAGTVNAKRNPSASVLPKYDLPNIKPQPFDKQDVLNIGAYVENTANNAIAEVNNSINSVGWEMPFGIQEEISGEKITIAITDIIFTPKEAGFNACLAFDIPEGGTDNKLALGAKNICFNGNTGLCGDALLTLVEDFRIDALNFTFIKATGNNKNMSGTFASFDPKGFKQLHIKAQYEFSQNVLVPQDTTKSVVKATFETDIKSWNNWYANVTVDPFLIKGYEEWGFALNNAYYDHSDSCNSPDMPKAAIAGKINHQNKDWMGFYIKEMDVTIPAIFKRADKKPITAIGKNIIIDNQGFTGDILGTDIFSITDGDLDGWYYSLDNINVNIVNSSFKKAGLGGKLLLPLSGKPSNTTKQDELDYTCTLSKPFADSALVFEFAMSPKANIKAKIWEGTLNVFNTSTIKVGNGKSKQNPSGKFIAEANLNGDISFALEGSSIPKIDFKLMKFDNLGLMSYAPYIKYSGVKLGFTSPDKWLGGFGVTITSGKLEINNTKADLTFAIDLTLADYKLLPSLPHGALGLTFEGDLNMTNGRPDWGNPVVKVDSIYLEGPLGPVTIDGYIKFFDNGNLGNGIKGALGVSLDLGINQTKIRSQIMFGNKNNTPNPFYYWYVDLLLSNSTGIMLVPPVSLFGLGGGVYYNMTKKSGYTANDLINGSLTNNLNLYTPAIDTIGFKASIVLGVGDGTPFHAVGEFSMELSKNMGVGKVGIDVDAAMMCDLNTEMYKAPVHGNGHIGYDFPNKTFDACIFLYVTAQPIIGSGYLALHIDRQNWFFNLGDPSQRIEINIASLFKLKAYLMMGKNIPGIPNPPYYVSNELPKYKINSRDNSISDMKSPGFAFGAEFRLEPVELTFLIFYMKLDADLGFDLTLKHYNEGCDGGQDLRGIDGWYANGQIYAMAHFICGIDVDIWVLKGTYSILDLSGAALFLGGVVNPIWLDGYIHGSYKLLDGLVSGEMNFHVQTGDKCLTKGNPFGSDLPIISDADPHDADTGVAIGRNPSVSFNFPVNQSFDVPSINDEGGEDINTFYIKLNEFSVLKKSDMSTVVDLNKNKKLSWTYDHKLATLFTDAAFKPQTEYILTVSVVAQDKYGNPLQYNNVDIKEDTTITFKTGDCPLHLDENEVNVVACYPFKNQRYLLQNEQPNGYIQLNKDVPPCLTNDSDYDLIAQFNSFQSPGNSTTQEVPVVQNDDELTFRIPKLPNNEFIQLRIIKRKAKANPSFKQVAALSYTNSNQYIASFKDHTIVTTEQTKISASSESGFSIAQEFELYSYYFKTSQYNTLAEKLTNSESTANAKRTSYGDVESYSAEFGFSEGFDVYDIKGSTFSADYDKYIIRPLISVSEQTPGNPWIQNFVAGFFYSNWYTAYTFGGDCQKDISPFEIRRYVTNAQCWVFEASMNPVRFSSQSAEPPLSEQEIDAATNKPYNIAVMHYYKP